MADAEGLRRLPAHEAYREQADAAPRSRDRLVELAMAVCIVGVLSALYIMNGQQAILRAHLANAFASKDENQVAYLEALALEGVPSGGDNGGVVGLAAMKRGATGLKFMPDGDTTYLVQWRCTTASAAEIEQELASGAGQATKTLRTGKAQAVALPAEDAPRICQGETRNAQ